MDVIHSILFFTPQATSLPHFHPLTTQKQFIMLMLQAPSTHILEAVEHTANVAKVTFQNDFLYTKMQSNSLLHFFFKSEQNKQYQSTPSSGPCGV
jgi:hypothetical protein